MGTQSVPRKPATKNQSTKSATGEKLSRCTGITLQALRCSRMLNNGNTRCFQHLDQSRDKQEKNKEKAERNKKRHRCAGVKRNGQKCTRIIDEEELGCWQHPLQDKVDESDDNYHTVEEDKEEYEGEHEIGYARSAGKKSDVGKDGRKLRRKSEKGRRM